MLRHVLRRLGAVASPIAPGAAAARAAADHAEGLRQLEGDHSQLPPLSDSSSSSDSDSDSK